MLDRVYGQPLLRGLTIDNVLDVVRVRDVHFWPFWANTGPVQDFTLENAIALESGRDDNPHYMDIFCYGYNIGMLFQRNPAAGDLGGITSRFHATNVDLDKVRRAIVVNGSQTTGQMSNVSTVGDPNSTGPAVHIQADEVKLQISNLRVSDFYTNGVRVEGRNSFAVLENVFIENWNRAGAGLPSPRFPAIEAVAPATCYVGRGRVFGVGNGAAATGGNVVLDS